MVMYENAGRQYLYKATAKINGKTITVDHSECAASHGLSGGAAMDHQRLRDAFTELCAKMADEISREVLAESFMSAVVAARR